MLRHSALHCPVCPCSHFLTRIFNTDFLLRTREMGMEIFLSVFSSHDIHSSPLIYPISVNFARTTTKSSNCRWIQTLIHLPITVRWQTGCVFLLDYYLNIWRGIFIVSRRVRLGRHIECSGGKNNKCRQSFSRNCNWVTQAI